MSVDVIDNCQMQHQSNANEHTNGGEQSMTEAGLSQRSGNRSTLQLFRKISNVGYLVLSGEGSGVRGGGVRGTAGLGAMEAAGTKP